MHVGGDHRLTDSWDIACNLENTYPDRPALFGGDIRRVENYFIGAQMHDLSGWKSAQPGYFERPVWNAFEHLDLANQDWWRQEREKELSPLKQYMDGREERAAVFRPRLEPLHTILTHQPFLGEDTPAYVD